LQHLQITRVTQFITTTLRRIWRVRFATAVSTCGSVTHQFHFRHFTSAGSPTNDPTQVFADAKDERHCYDCQRALSPWRGSVNDFRDPHLLELTAPVAEIEICMAR